jgi:hypothetical protein
MDEARQTIRPGRQVLLPPGAWHRRRHSHAQRMYGFPPRDDGDQMSEEKECDGDLWETLFGRLLHETQVKIIEAMRWIDRPLSASELTKVLYGTPNLSGVSYHIRRLKDLGVLKDVKWRQVRGASEKFYRLVSKPNRGRKER